MKRFIEGESRNQSTLFSESLDDYVREDNPIRVIDVFVGELDLGELGFSGVEPSAIGRPAYHPSVLLKLYVYGYMNRIHSSRRLEQESQRNVEVTWLTGRLMPDFKTIADFRKDNGKAIQGVCREFVMLCRNLNLFTESMVAIDGSKFKAVNARDKNFTRAKMKRRMDDIDKSIEEYMCQLDTADRQEELVRKADTTRLKDKIAKLKNEMKELKAEMLNHPDNTIPFRICTSSASHIWMNISLQRFWMSPRPPNGRINVSCLSFSLRIMCKPFGWKCHLPLHFTQS